MMAEVADSEHRIHCENVEDELYVHIDHPMEKGHYISFVALINDSRIQLEKLYPQQTAELRFRRAGHGILYAYCNRHGLFFSKI